MSAYLPVPAILPVHLFYRIHPNRGGANVHYFDKKKYPNSYKTKLERK